MNRIPLLGAIAVVLHQGNVLLARRAKSPGLWGFPGGHVEWGETAMAAATRELAEETGVIADARRYLTNVDVLMRDQDGAVAVHYLLAAVQCTYLRGAPVAADDVAEARWFAISEVERAELPLHPQVCEVLAQART